MKECVNEVRLSGNAGGDPDMRYLANGTALVKWSLAVERMVPAGNGMFRPSTMWARLTAWGDLAEQVSVRLRKGEHHEVLGELESHSWEKDDGTKGYDWGVRVSEVRFDDVVLKPRPRGRREQAAPARGPDPRTESGYPPGSAASKAWSHQNPGGAQPPDDSLGNGDDGEPPPTDPDGLPFE